MFRFHIINSADMFVLLWHFPKPKALFSYGLQGLSVHHKLIGQHRHERGQPDPICYCCLYPATTCCLFQLQSLRTHHTRRYGQRNREYQFSSGFINFNPISSLRGQPAVNQVATRTTWSPPLFVFGYGGGRLFYYEAAEGNAIQRKAVNEYERPLGSIRPFLIHFCLLSGQ